MFQSHLRCDRAGIIKGEYLENYEVNTLKVAKQLLERVVEVYNNERPHMSLGNQTPSLVHNGITRGEKLWKSYTL